MTEYRISKGYSYELGLQYHVTSSCLGWMDLLNHTLLFSGTDDPNLAHLGLPTAEDHATMTLGGTAIQFIHSVTDCISDSLLVSIADLIDIYRDPTMRWSELHSRHPQANFCLRNVHETISAYHLNKPCGSNYIVQNAFHSSNNTGWTEASAQWTSPLNNPFGFLVTTPDQMLQLVSNRPHSMGYVLLTTPISGYPVMPFNMINNGGWTVSPGPATIQNITTFDNSHLNITCEHCWPLVGYAYFVIPRYTTLPKSEELKPLTLRSCINLRALSDFFLWTLDDDMSKRAGGLYFSPSPVEAQRVRDQLESLRCNGKSVLRTDWTLPLRSQNIALHIILPLLAFIGAFILATSFIKWRERKNINNIKMLSRFGALEDEMGLNMYMMDNMNTNVGSGAGAGSIMHGDDVAYAAMSSTSTSSGNGGYKTSSLQRGGSPSGGRGSGIGGNSNNNASSSSSSAQYGDFTLAKVLISHSDLTIGSLIGSGSYGEVYTGVYKHKLVAIKRIASSTDSHMIQSFLQESRAMVALDHPNVLRLLAIAIKSPYTYIVSEYCKYGSLEDYLKNQPKKATIANKLGLVLGAAKGMAYLHSKDITHRDLKPTNLLVAENDVVKVGDLGTATRSRGGVHSTIVGTLDYSAPEVLDGQPYTNSCDIYSFGICLWALFSNQPLYPGWSQYDIVMKVVPGARPPIDAITSPKLSKLITSCWDANPSARPTFDTIVRLLASIDSSDFIAGS